MLHNLKYTIRFSSTRKTFSQDINLKPGLTVITGANEKGKSLILEMIEYALFGAAALRGILSDYDQLDVELTFEVKGEKYKVVRTGSRATLNGKLAVGTAAVNRKILEILKFDLDVWHIACSAKQGELDKLTARMRPTARRQMVDEVIGLNQLETVEKDTRSDANSHKKAAELLTAKLIEPTEPNQPENYEPSLTLEVKYSEAIKREAEIEQLEKLQEPVAPVEPIKPDYSDDVCEHEQTRKQTDLERDGIERDLRRIPTITRTRQDILSAFEYYERGPQSEYTADQLQQWQKDWELIRSAGDTVECPDCGTVFNPRDSTRHNLPGEPPLALSEIARESTKLARWSDYTGEPITSVDMTEQEANDQYQALMHEDYRQELLARLESLPVLEDRSDEYRLKETYERASEIFRYAQSEYERACASYRDSQQRLHTLTAAGTVDSATFAEALKNSRIYEEQKRRYDADCVAFNEAVAIIAGEKALAEAYSKGAEALRDARTMVKQHLIPSLNKVASSLLSQMTDGERNQIVVDDDFEVEVDGQHVRTLSGSGISVVNLALRIALGQVLTQSIVPVFLADEIDKDMDDDRAKATHQSLRNLSNILKQVIVVSHKHIEGDQIIGL